MVKAESDYPQDLIAPAGPVVRPQEPVAPGANDEVSIEATSTVWETDRLTALMSDSTNRIGGLFMFNAPDGERSIAELSSPIVPHFYSADARHQVSIGVKPRVDLPPGKYTVLVGVDEPGGRRRLAFPLAVGAWWNRL